MTTTVLTVLGSQRPNRIRAARDGVTRPGRPRVRHDDVSPVTVPGARPAGRPRRPRAWGNPGNIPGLPFDGPDGRSAPPHPGVRGIIPAGPFDGLPA